jgi:hypothetical protein
MGRVGEAKQLMEAVGRIGAGVKPNLSFWRKPEHRELLLSGLRLATCDAT